MASLGYCARRTFAERLKPWARHTWRLASAQPRVGVALGGQAGALLKRQTYGRVGLELLQRRVLLDA